MSQSKILIVLKHEFLQKVRSKGYIILTLLAPLLLASTALIPLFIATLSSDEKKNICVIDETSVIASKLIESNKDTVKDSFSKNFQKDVVFTLMDGQGSTEALTDSAKKLIGAKKIEGVFVIPKDIITNTKAKASLKLRNTSDFSVQRVISKRYEDILIQLRLQEKGIDSKTVSEASDNVDIDVVKVTVSAEAKDDGFSFIAGYMSGMLLYVTLLIYGSLIMQSVIEEKSSRIIEILVSSLTPRDLLLGKILGLGVNDGGSKLRRTSNDDKPNGWAFSILTYELCLFHILLSRWLPYLFNTLRYSWRSSRTSKRCTVHCYANHNNCGYVDLGINACYRITVFNIKYYSLANSLLLTDTHDRKNI
jgi:hypothetical protein